VSNECYVIELSHKICVKSPCDVIAIYARSEVILVLRQCHQLSTVNDIQHKQQQEASMKSHQQEDLVTIICDTCR